MTNDELNVGMMVSALIVQGHRVASGQNGNPLFPGGTLKMQLPFFLGRGLDLSGFHLGTLNMSIAPLSYVVVKARHTFRQVKWHPTEPAEDFSFFDVVVHRDDGPPVRGFVYFPHPDTKPTHFQKADVLELLLPWTEGLEYGKTVRLVVPDGQMTFV